MVYNKWFVHNHHTFLKEVIDINKMIYYSTAASASPLPLLAEESVQFSG